jgi:hypothetical protein
VIGVACGAKFRIDVPDRTGVRGPEGTVRHVTGAILLACVGAVAVDAADYPVPGRKLLLKRSATNEKLVLVLNDPAVPVPPPTSPDAPSTAGLELEVTGGTSLLTATLVAPGGTGWSASSVAAPTRYRYSNPAAPAGSPIRLVKLRGSRSLKILARQAGLPLTTPEGRVAIRITMGNTRVCALFDGPSVKKDEPGIFLAQDAPAPTSASCSDDVIGIPCESSQNCDGACAGDGECGGEPELGCVCASPSQPCGDTAPVCNGQCPAGEECANIGGVPYPNCACLPVGSTPCGSVYPACGDGDCASGLTCMTLTFTCCGGTTITNCGCASSPPPPPCGGTCPPGWTCVQVPGQPEFCLPPFCDGGTGAPTCDGACSAPEDHCYPYQGSCFCLDACTGGDSGTSCGGTCSDGTCQMNPSTGLCACAP